MKKICRPALQGIAKCKEKCKEKTDNSIALLNNLLDNYSTGDTAKTGQFTSIVSRLSLSSETKNKIVAAVSLKMTSLDSVILPSGYLFAVTDNNGKVLYHSDRLKILMKTC